MDRTASARQAYLDKTTPDAFLRTTPREPIEALEPRKENCSDARGTAFFPTCRKYPSEVPAGSCRNGAKRHQLFFELSGSDDIRMFAFELRELSG
jgi:hypothetical protein